MAPLYSWFDEENQEQFDIYKESFSQYQEEPKEDELPEAARGKKRKWTKRLGGGIKVVKGESWGPGKGHW